MSPTWWSAPASPGPLHSTVCLPGSKSQTNRALLLGAISTTPLRITGPLLSRDTLLALEGLRHFGVTFAADSQGRLTVTAPERLTAHGVIDCGLAGTVLRFFPALAAFADGSVRFEGDPAALTRPLLPLLRAVEQLGATIQYHGQEGYLPFTVTGNTGPVPPHITIDSSASSQFLSALLLASPLAPTPIDIVVDGDVPSRPHVQMTVQMLADQGVSISAIGPSTWRTEPGRPAGRNLAIEPDLSNAGPFLAAALICGGSVTVPDWPTGTTQAGDAWLQILPQFGADITLGENRLTVSASGTDLPGVDLDLSQVGELTPTIAALCALASSPSTLRGIAHLRGHETDRLAALVTEIERVGGTTRIIPDGLEITPGQLRPADFESYHDHRMATFGALLGLAAPGSRVRDVETTAKTLPDFVERWTTMLSGGPSPLPSSLAEHLHG